MSVSPQEWARVKGVFDAAVALDAAARPAYLASACGDDAALRQRVETMLASHDGAPTFLETPAAVILDRPRAAPDAMIGRVIGPYRLVAHIGAGGMGDVYKAEDSKLDRPVALKLLPAHLSTDPDRLRRFHAEARAASSLNHPHIVVVHDFGEIDGRPFIVTELVEGQTLRQRLQAGAIPVREAIDIASQVAGALAAAHARGLVHRDIKPENVMQRPDGYIKVLDFGLAKLMAPPDETSIAHTQAGTVMGTPRYMSPEQARGLDVDARSDIWSLGVTLYEMLAGRPPFDGPTSSDVMAAVLHHSPAPIVTGSSRQIPPDLERLVLRCLEKTTQERFQSAQDLASSLRAVGTSPATSPVTESPEAIDSLAVLPFVNAGGNPDTEYLSDGIAESLINSLTQIPFLRVVPRSKAFRYKGQDVDAREVGRQLKVRALLTGKVLQRGDSLNVQAELVDVERDAQLWGERFNLKMGDIFTVEEAIAKQISEKLRLKLTGQERERLLKRHTENTEAYHLYLKGRYHWNKRTADGLRKAVEYFQQAIDKDPSYALAYAGLADGYIVLGFFAPSPAKGFAARGKAAGLTALAIDAGLSEAFTALGIARCVVDWDWAEAERDLRRAIDLKPDSWLAHDHYAMVLSILGRHEEAVREVRRGLELEPLSLVVSHHVAWVFIQARLYDEAIDQIRRALEMDPNFAMGQYWLGLACSLTSRYDEAIPALQAARVALGSTFATLELARTYAASGQTAEAQRLLAEMHAAFAKDYAEPYGFAWVYAALGQPDHAFQWLERAWQDRTGFLALWVSRDPRLDSLRSDPRMSDLLRRMGLEAR